MTWNMEDAPESPEFQSQESFLSLRTGAAFDITNEVCHVLEFLGYEEENENISIPK